MTTDRRCLVDTLDGAGVQMGDVTTLKDEEDNPVDAGDDVVHTKSSAVVIVLAPYPPPMQDSIVRCMERVVDRDDQG